MTAIGLAQAQPSYDLVIIIEEQTLTGLLVVIEVLTNQATDDLPVVPIMLHTVYTCFHSTVFHGLATTVSTEPIVLGH